MPRGKRIDEQKVLELLRQPKRPSDQQIATQLGYASETVRLKRHKFESKGLIEDKPAKRGRPSKKRAQTKAVDIKNDHELTLEQAEELLIIRFKEATEVKFLRNRVAALENELRIVKADRDELKKFYDGKREKARQFALAQQQGEIHSPVGEKNSNLTYHLLLRPSPDTFKSLVQYNIKSDNSVRINIRPSEDDDTPPFLLDKPIFLDIPLPIGKDCSNFPEINKEEERRWHNRSEAD